MNLQEGGEAFSFMSRIARTISRLIQTNEIFGRNLPALIESAMTSTATRTRPTVCRNEFGTTRSFSAPSRPSPDWASKEEAIAWFTFWLGFDPRTGRRSSG
jgi:hypothetical protein